MTAASELPPYVEYGALASAPGPLLCETARLYCFFVDADADKVQALCDHVLSVPTGGAVRYRISRLAPVVFSIGSIGGLRSLNPSHAGRGSAFEPEAAIWIPVIAQRRVEGRFVDDRFAIFMPYIWVDDPIAFASGREVYGFAKTQGWMPDLGDPRRTPGDTSAVVLPDPPQELFLDVYGTEAYNPGAELGRTRLLTVNRLEATRGGLEPLDGGGATPPEGRGLDELVDHFRGALDPEGVAEQRPPEVRRSIIPRKLGGFVHAANSMRELAAEQTLRHVFLKQFRDAALGDRAALQQVVEARSQVVPGTLSWRRLNGRFELKIESLVTQPLHEELGVSLRQTVRHAFIAQFGFRMEPGVVVWPQGS